MSERDGRTEKPTAKRRREARRDGRVARSQDISSWLSLLGFLLVLPALAGRAEATITGLISLSAQAMADPDNGKAMALLGDGLKSAMELVLPVALVATLVGLASTLAQVGFRFSPGVLGFKLSKLSPRNGIKKIVSVRGLWDLGKNFLRLFVLVLGGYLTTHELVERLIADGTLPLGSSLSIALAGVTGLLRTVGIIALLFGLGDYLFQRHQVANSLKMTRDEVKQEMKDQEGNPEIKRAIKRRQRALTRMQMIAAIARADVVVVNPTHYAVGLAYERARHRAPTVVAKGEDEIAAAIRSAALDRRIPIVESPPLARALHASCKIGEEIPPLLYEVVAKLFAFVYRLSPAAKALVDVHHLVAKVPADALPDEPALSA
ncbi:MAG TPA: EscU/YscU/HrcU family type III secretion system export apparatus switch protein [Acidimicrobiales bacterium]|nr:EscU/YscU/HrcU family type III secretion system export apparatus switch protein [Acidimicrobiales bacterium]